MNDVIMKGSNLEILIKFESVVYTFPIVNPCTRMPNTPRIVEYSIAPLNRTPKENKK